MVVVDGRTDRVRMRGDPNLVLVGRNARRGIRTCGETTSGSMSAKAPATQDAGPPCGHANDGLECCVMVTVTPFSAAQAPQDCVNFAISAGISRCSCANWI